MMSSGLFVYVQKLRSETIRTGLVVLPMMTKLILMYKRNKVQASIIIFKISVLVDMASLEVTGGNGNNGGLRH